MPRQVESESVYIMRISLISAYLVNNFLNSIVKMQKRNDRPSTHENLFKVVLINLA